MKRRIGSLTERIVGYRQWTPVRLTLISAYTKSTAVAFFFAALAAAIAILPAAARVQQLTSFSDTTGEHVFYVSQSQHVLQLYWNTSSWSPQDLTSISGATTVAIAPGLLSSFYDTSGEHVFYIGSGFHIYQLYLSWGANLSGSGWVNQDLTKLSQATNVASEFFGASASMSDIS
jgi:hypothetical protein